MTPRVALIPGIPGCRAYTPKVPKIVDKAVRRDEIIAATWRIIRTQGFDAVTLREIAAMLGYANGALKPYFATKEELLTAAYVRAFDVAVEKANASIGGRTGIEALRRLCHEIMPLDEERTLEAAVIIAYWGHSLGVPALAEIFRQHSAELRRRMIRHLEEGRAAGEVVTSEPDGAIADELYWMMMGLQAMVLFAPEHASGRRQRAALEKILESLAH